MATITTADFKVGVILKLENGIFRILDVKHTHMARGSATVRVKMQNVETGQVLEKVYQAKDKAEQVSLDRSSAEYLYRDGDLFYFMDPDSFEQMPIAKEVLGEALAFLIENTTVKFLSVEGRVIGVELPDTMELEIAETEPGLRGDTVSGATKPAKLQTGYVVQVPLFVEQGERIKVNTKTGDYLGRA